MNMSKDEWARATDVRVAVLRLARRLRRERNDEVLTPSQLAVLGSLASSGPSTPGELAALERVRPPSMTRIISSLEAEGLVARTPHPDDGRQILVQLTPAAESRIAAVRERRNAWLALRMADLSDEDRALILAAAPILNRLACE